MLPKLLLLIALFAPVLTVAAGIFAGRKKGLGPSGRKRRGDKESS